MYRWANPFLWVEPSKLSAVSPADKLLLIDSIFTTKPQGYLLWGSFLSAAHNLLCHIMNLSTCQAMFAMEHNKKNERFLNRVGSFFRPRPVDRRAASPADQESVVTAPAEKCAARLDM